ncbi:MAG: amino acid permease [Planctomycetaceae bacterium]|nr:amino acid permease [Planctomycetales bacterium]MCB9923417.1 amino acid permease [Planctomycetaceae bacterium]
MSSDSHSERSLGLIGATGVGVGAIVGGGILALAGAAFVATGPSAVIAFALNGIIAMLTALSFAEVSSKFPQSGGTYTFAKKVLSVEAAFTVGWVVWFASIVASVLYAFGFAQFAVVVTKQLWFGDLSPGWLDSRWIVCATAITATAYYAAVLSYSKAGGGQWLNVGKVVVFGVLILGGAWAMRGRSVAELSDSLTPFFASAAPGLFTAMGFTFIALQGFDLIAAVAGEVREPSKTIPRAMFLSLGIAILIYLPLLIVISTVGVSPEESITEVSQLYPDTIVAIAARNYLGAFGYWLVMGAAVLSMLSALQANLFAASRVAVAMARDRTLPRSLALLNGRYKTPANAVILTATVVIVIILIVPDLASAGAASSLIFLVTFALAHWIAILVRQRSITPPPFRSPMFPLVPVAGGLSCVSLAIYQGVAVPSAGFIAMFWIALGGILFLSLFAHRARVADATNSALDPEVVTLRGRSPLVLVPIARPDSAEGLVGVANALAPPGIGRVLMLSVVVAPSDWDPVEERRPLENTQAVLGEALRASSTTGVYPEALATVAREPWDEIARVAKTHRCETLLLGLSELTGASSGSSLEQLINRVDCDVVLLRAPKGWQLGDANRVLVPTGGQGGHDRLLARLLGSLARTIQRQVTLAKVIPTHATRQQEEISSRDLTRLNHDLCDGAANVRLIQDDDAIESIANAAADHDLVILGARRARREKVLGDFVLGLARRTEVPLLIICRGR